MILINKLKKIFLIFSPVFLIFLFSGCSKQDDKKPTTAENDGKSVYEKKDKELTPIGNIDANFIEQQDKEIFPIEDNDESFDTEFVEEENPLDNQMYNDLIGNLSSSINDSEKRQIKFFIKELMNLSNNENNKKSEIFKDIIKILDEVTLRTYDNETLEPYKKYYTGVSGVSLPEILCKYEINKDGTISSTEKSERSHELLWENTKTIIPFDLLKDIKYFAPFQTPGIDSNQSIAGFIMPDDNSKNPPYDWKLGINANMNKTILPYILIHEYGHFISLQDATENFIDISKPKSEAGKVLQNFIENCNGCIIDELENVDESNHYLFYARHKDDFVTMYAATNSMEDFAESFARFVTDYPCNTERLIRKKQFFENNQYYMGLKNKILNNWKANGINNVINCTK